MTSNGADLCSARGDTGIGVKKLCTGRGFPLTRVEVNHGRPDRSVRSLSADCSASSRRAFPSSVSALSSSLLNAAKSF
jgi:hypothetical protein